MDHMLEQCSQQCQLFENRGSNAAGRSLLRFSVAQFNSRDLLSRAGSQRASNAKCLAGLICFFRGKATQSQSQTGPNSTIQRWTGSNVQRTHQLPLCNVILMQVTNSEGRDQFQLKHLTAEFRQMECQLCSQHQWNSYLYK